jgi:signal transduction histidine kinase
VIRLMICSQFRVLSTSNPMRYISLKTKVVLPVTLLVVVAMLLALVIVNYVVRNQVKNQIGQDIKSARLLFSELENMQTEILVDRGLVAINAPHLKAAMDTGDSTTVQKVADELFKSIHNGMFVITGRDHRILAKNGIVLSHIKLSSDSLFLASGSTNDEQIGKLMLSDGLYQGLVLPISTRDASFGEYLLGRVLLANALNQDYLARMRDLVNAEIILLYNSTIILSTFAAEKDFAIDSVPRDNMVNAITVGKEEYLCISAGAENCFLLLRSIDAELQAIMKPIQNTLIFVAVFGITVAFLIRFYISHEIVTPLKKLDTATDAFADGEYGHALEVRANDEIGQLAHKFESMREALQQRMTQLKQRNTELETAMKQLESAQKELIQAEKLAATGKITAQLSHELNNPIHNIRGCLEAAQRKLNGGQESAEFIELAHREVKRMGSLIHQMLNFYRPQITNVTSFNVNTVIREVFKASECRLSQQHIDVKLDLRDNIPEINNAADQLKQVLLNLISNAIDAMPDGGKLTVTTEKSQDKILIAVVDTGVGIPVENHDKIFDAFFTTKDKASGVGLGLSVSYGIMNSLGGSITVESDTNQGTEFHLELPV